LKAKLGNFACFSVLIGVDSYYDNTKIFMYSVLKADTKIQPKLCDSHSLPAPGTKCRGQRNCMVFTSPVR